MPLFPAPAELPTAFATTVADASLELDHLGLIVPELEAGRVFLQALGVSRWTRVIEDPALQVCVQFGSAPGGELNYELISPLGETSPIANALRTGKHILNHLAYLTHDLNAAADRLREAGCYPAGEPKPAAAYGGSLVQFWMSPLRFVIELIEKPGHRHMFVETVK